jgi:hypothetical protein
VGSPGEDPRSPRVRGLGGGAREDKGHERVGLSTLQPLGIPVRVTKADRDLLKRMAPGGSVSAWLRDLAIAAARRRETRARQVLARLATIATMVPADLLGGVNVVESDPDDDVLFATALAVGSFAGVMVVSAAEFMATLGEA